MAITEKYANFNLATGLNDGSSEANAWQTPGAITFAAGERVNLKCTTRATLGSDWLISSNGTTTQPILIRGYTTTIGDGGKALLDETVNISGNYVIAGNLDIEVSGTADPGLVVDTGDNSAVYNIKVVNTATGTITARVAEVAEGSAYNCYFEGRGASGGTVPVLEVDTASMSGIVVKSTNGQPGVGINSSFNPSFSSGLLVYSGVASSNKGIEFTGFANNTGTLLTRFTVDNFATGVYFVGDSVTSGALVCNGVISNATTAIDTDEATDVMGVTFNNIAFYNNTTDCDMGDNEVYGQIDCTADPYTDASSEDFSPNNTAGGGALLRSAALIGAGAF